MDPPIEVPVLSERQDLTMAEAVRERDYLHVAMKAGNWNTAFLEQIERRIAVVEKCIVDHAVADYKAAHPWQPPDDSPEGQANPA